MNKNTLVLEKEEKCETTLDKNIIFTAQAEN